MADEFKLNPDAVNSAISSIAGAISGLGSLDMNLNAGDVNNTESFNQYKTKVDMAKSVITAEFPEQLQNALRSMSTKVEALKDMESRLSEMIKSQSSTLPSKNGQGGSQGFKG